MNATTHRPTAIAPILIAACGNAMAGADAFGPLVVQVLRERSSPGIEIIDLSMNPAELLQHLEGRRALILIDALVDPEHEEGELLDLDCLDPQNLSLLAQPAGATHDFGLAWQLRLAKALDLLPPTARLIALVIREARIGQPLPSSITPQVRQTVQMVHKLARTVHPEC